MKRDTKKRLELAKQKLRELSTSELPRAGGGQKADPGGGGVLTEGIGVSGVTAA